jgi:HTH-type transcriptional regulator/antitoxin HigA
MHAVEPYAIGLRGAHFKREMSGTRISSPTNDDELEVYTKAFFSLTSIDHPNTAHAEAIELLSLLLEHYESQRYSIPAADPVTVLRFLMEQNGLSQRDIVQDIGGSESLVSMIMNGQRNLTVDHIRNLSARFDVSASVFIACDCGGPGRAAK